MGSDKEKRIIIRWWSGNWCKDHINILFPPALSTTKLRILL